MRKAQEMRELAKGAKYSAIMKDIAEAASAGEYAIESRSTYTPEENRERERAGHCVYGKEVHDRLIEEGFFITETKETLGPFDNVPHPHLVRVTTKISWKEEV